MGTNKGIKLAICGGARSGKDTAAGYLEERFDFGVFPLGEPMRKAFHEIFPNIPRVPKPRSAYQRFAESCREIDGSVWLEKTLEIWQDETASGFYTHAVIPDLRHPDDYRRLRAEGWKILRIQAPGWMRSERAKALGDQFTPQDLTHATEIAYLNFEVDYEVSNTQGKEWLYGRLDTIVNKELGL